MADPLNRFVPGEIGWTLPLLDRLLDDEPDRHEEPLVRPVEQVRQLREAVRRDLEALLNTRRPPASPPKHHPQLEDALLSYGLDGLVAAHLGTDGAKHRFARGIERRIALFETRLSNVEVTVLQNRTERERALRMRIEATFRIDAAMPPIRFESTLDPSSHRIAVEDPNG